MIKRVTELDLGHNQIGDQGAHVLADVLQGDAVKILSLFLNIIRRYIQLFNQIFTKLEITGNPITTNAARYLSQTLRHKLVNIFLSICLSLTSSSFYTVTYHT
jgi:Ran GTPase-activating protein (RanGAP) involved in mRNA processing and transport